MTSQQTGERRLIDADVLLDKTVRRNRAWNSITNSEGKTLEEIILEMLSVEQQEPKTGHCTNCKWWKDSDGESED